MSIDEAAYAYGGVRALVQLHERHLRSFLAVWKRAREAGVTLPESEDPNCLTLDNMLTHVLRAARGYMVWMCQTLELPDPQIDAAPDDIVVHADSYMEHVLQRWDGPLRGLDEETVDRTTAASSWGVVYCIDAMLEHAVMHPIRHELQLERAMP